jgi:hypothetical protein
MHMIRPPMPFFNLTLLLLCPPTEYLPRYRLSSWYKVFLRHFGLKSNRVLALPLPRVYAFLSSIVELLFVCFGSSR